MTNSPASRVLDGFSAVPLGVSGADHPLDVPEGAVFRLVNGTVRSSRVATRPSFRELELDLPSGHYQEIFLRGKFQGAYGFDGPSPSLVFAVSGHVFLLDLTSSRVTVLTESVGKMDSRADRLYFLSTGRYLIVQDGSSRPIIYDGSSAWRSRFEEQEVPVGTFMAYGHGRIFVTVAGSPSFIAGDFELPNDPESCLFFTETEYLNEGGAFSLPAAFGRITGLAFLRAPATTDSLGPLVVSGETGISYFNVAYPRAGWSQISISSVGVIGHGVASHASLVNIGDDLLYLSNEGDLRTVQTSQQATSSQVHRAYSREVYHWLKDNTLSLLPFGSAILHDRRILATVAAEYVASEVEGESVVDVRHKGILALDYDRAGGVQANGLPAYDGLWTGVRPLGLASCRALNRAFVFSRTDSGITRLYEITDDPLDAGNRLPEMVVQPRSLMFLDKDGRRIFFQRKRFEALEVWLEDVIGDAVLSYSISADGGPWVHGPEVTYTAERLNREGPLNLSPGSWASIVLQPPERAAVCHPGNKTDGVFGFRFDVRIRLIGRATITAVRAIGSVYPEQGASPVCHNSKARFDIPRPNDYEFDIIKARPE